MKKLKEESKLLLGYAISGMGDQFYIFAIPLLMLSKTHSSIIMGLLTAVEISSYCLVRLDYRTHLRYLSKKKNYAYFTSDANVANTLCSNFDCQ
ncbi:hypothetical protein [Lactobacillus apis]|uniref:hypothetical protein n=1 Tax=Lactobacillus apis TaxID=303541 RepID=UPI00164F6BAB|nr:hypothetical protein [Lactobacillus apis]